ncbi:MAG: NAD(P)/FAD-dependent oxidoreductase [Thermodesulfobacteriota bacterium]
MTKYHTIITGGGPAGLACATMLAQAGKKTMLLERNRRIGPKVCAGGITWSGIKNRVPANLIEKSFCEQRVCTRWQQTIISGREPLVSTIDREILGQWMLKEALAAGVEVKTATPARSFTDNHLQTDSEEFEFRFLVGADGSGSTIRRLLNIPTDKVGVGINYFVPGDFPAMEWHLNNKFFANGYGWIFPHSHSASIGAYADRQNMPPARLKKNFHLWAEKHGINLGQAKMSSALINYDFRGYRFGNCFLVGDAAGLASALTGEGIYPAIISGEEAAQTILNPDYDSIIMKKLLARHNLHRRVVSLTGSNKLTCRMVTEAMVLALRKGLIPFSALEMAS